MVGWTLVNILTLASVTPDRTLGHIVVDVPIHRVRRKIQPAIKPVRTQRTVSVLYVGFAGEQPIGIILAVQAPSQRELLAGVHALDALRLELGLRQSGNQHSCQYGYDRDYY